MKKIVMALVFLALVGAVEAKKDSLNRVLNNLSKQQIQTSTQQCAKSLSVSADKSYPPVDLSQVNTVTAKWVITNAKNITSCQGQDFKNSVKKAKKFLRDNSVYLNFASQSDQYAGFDDSGEPVY